MASIQPVAGAQYYWTWSFAPANLRRFLTWLQGWATWTGYVALLASCINGLTVLLEGIVGLTHDYEARGWHTALINIAIILLCAGVNVFAFALIPWFELLAGVLNICLLIIFLVVLWTLSPKNDRSIFLDTNLVSGWHNYFVSANVGSLSNIFVFLCKSSSPMKEVTKNS